MMAKDKGIAGAMAPMGDHDWSAEEELQLFHAMEGLRPVGINKHFYMSCIADRLCKSLNREIPSELIWRHLGTMYKLKELDELESLPFPNDEREFSLPEQDYAALLTKKSTGVGEESTEAVLGATIIAVATDSNVPTKSAAMPANQNKELDKKASTKILDLHKRSAKRTRGSMSNESISPCTTPPPVQNNKRRRI